MINRQFYTMKFLSSRLKEADYNVSLTFNEGKKEGEIIALADNQMLRTIRDIRKEDVSKDLIEKLFLEREKIKKNGINKDNIKEFNKIQNRINHVMFIPDYVTVIMEQLSHYEYIYKNGVIINGKLYKRLSCSASQARVSTVVLCNTEIIDEVKERLNNGRNLEKKFSPSKFNAYFGLYSSATKLVSEPKFIVVKDFINKTSFKTNYVTETEWDLDDIITQKEIELEMNRTDGMGLISPRQAKIWADDLDLDYIPAQFCVRQSFIKGMVCTFDIHKFCEEVNHGNYIVETIYKDNNGDFIKVDLRYYDIIITESQFKLWDSYDNINNYIDLCHKNKLYWGVTQYTPKEPKDILKLNYQFIQTLNLNEKDVQELASQFVEWITGVTYDNMAYTLLFLLGVNNDEEKIVNFIKSSENYWLKSLIVNQKLKNDKYIRNKIYNLIKTQIRNGCLGSIFVDGNFQVIVSDPYGFMQHVCGQEVTGLLKKDEFYSNYWNKKGVNQVDSMRSPLTYRSEHVVLNLRDDELVNKWFKYCYVGIIVNYHGHESVNWSGSDYDFDILSTTSSKVMIKGTYKDELTVVYDPPKPEKIVFTEDDLYKSDTFAFGSIIGSITNKGSNGYALLPLIIEECGIDSKEFEILNSRIQQCCKAQSMQIDKTKIGREVKGIPKIWINKQSTDVDDFSSYENPEEIVHMNTILNHILLDKYPYFFRYLYKDANTKFSRYAKVCNMKSETLFNLKVDELEKLQDKTLEQQQFLNNYYKHMPLICSDSAMNLLCRYIESIKFDLSKSLRINSNSNIYLIYKNSDYKYTDIEYNQIKSSICEYVKTIKYIKNSDFVEDIDIDKDNDDILSELQSNAKKELLNISNNIYVIVNCLVDYFYVEKPSMNKDILWILFGDIIFINVKNNSNSKITFPFPDKNGNIKYLGKKYSLREVDL